MGKSLKACKPKNRSLLVQHLEDISWKVMEEYPQVVRGMIRKRFGVYALYRKGRLHYVGLANNLIGRLKTHLRDRHGGSWDRFSVYLTSDAEHMRELESLLIRIAKPTGNRVIGGFARSKSLFGQLNEEIKEIDADRRAVILGGAVARRRRRTKVSRKSELPLAGFAERHSPLRARYKGQTIRASLRTDGTIYFQNKVYRSPSSAGRAVLGRACDGWAFWKYKNEKGKWVSLRSLRR